MSNNFGLRGIASDLLKPLGFEAGVDFSFAWLDGNALRVLTTGTDDPVGNARKFVFAQRKLALLSVQNQTIYGLHFDPFDRVIVRYSNDVAKEISISLADLTPRGGGMQQMLDSGALLRFLGDSDSDRRLVQELLERQQCVYLTEMETDVARLGTKDIAATGVILPPRLAIESSVKKYWDLLKLAEYKRQLRVLEVDNPDSVLELTWDARGTDEHQQMTDYELRNRGRVRLVTFRSRVHRIVEVFESVELRHCL